jgi:hypothetical protein
MLYIYMRDQYGNNAGEMHQYLASHISDLELSPYIGSPHIMLPQEDTDDGRVMLSIRWDTSGGFISMA